MRHTLLTISLLSFAAFTSACSRNRASTAPSTSPTAAASDAAQRENAKIQSDASDSDAAAAAAAAARTKTRAGDKEAITAPVYFQFDRSEISEDGMRILDQKVDALQRNPNVQLRIEGNADDSGSDEYNLALSQRRAASPVNASIRRTPADTAVSEMILNNWISPSARTCVPPHSSTE